MPIIMMKGTNGRDIPVRLTELGNFEAKYAYLSNNKQETLQLLAGFKELDIHWYSPPKVIDSEILDGFHHPTAFAVVIVKKRLVLTRFRDLSTVSQDKTMAFIQPELWQHEFYGERNGVLPRPVLPLRGGK